MTNLAATAVALIVIVIGATLLINELGDFRSDLIAAFV